MTLSYTLVAYCLVPVLMLLLVIRPIIRERNKSRRPSIKEWRNLSGSIRTMSKADLNDRSLSGPTRTALSMMLGERPGHSNKGNMPFALQILDDAGAHSAATIRAASTLAVFIGLFGTAVVFAGILSGDSGELSSKLSDLSAVYIINCAAVLLAIFAFAYSRHIEDDVHDVNYWATMVLSQLPDHDESEVDPLLLSTLRAMTSQMQQSFADNMGHLHEQQLSDIRAIVGEVRGLADSIREGVQAFRKKSETDTIAILEANRETLAAVETSAVRLDSALGRVVTDGVPALSRLTESAESLRAASMRFESSGALDAMASVSRCVEDLRRLVDAWPGSIEGALAAAQTRVETAAVDGVRNAGAAMTSAVDASTGRIENLLRESAGSLPAAVADASAVTLRQWQEQSLAAVAGLSSTTASLRDNAKALEAATTRLNDTLRKLDSLIEKSAGRRWPF